MRATSSGNLKADIVIIGGGGSGLSAAASALEQGAKSILILEKRNKLGGNAVNPAGLLAANSRLQARLGMNTSRDQVFRHAMEYAHWKLNAPLIRAIVDRSSDTIEWLEKKGIHFTNIVTHFPNQNPNTYHMAAGKESTGAQIVKALSQQCEASSKVKILTETSAQHLLVDQQGKIIGVTAVDKNKKPLNINTPCVIVCTGGYSGNEQLIKKYDPFYHKEEVIPRGIPQKGEGIRMTSEIGAVLDGMGVYEWEQFFWGSACLTVLVRQACTLWINKKGKRFTDESILVMGDAANAIGRQPGRSIYCLFDETIKKKIEAMPLTPLSEMFLKFDETVIKKIREGQSTPLQEKFIRGEDSEAGTAYFADQVEKDLKTFSAEGKVKISRSWDEIAEWIGAQPDVLRSTVREYNEYCERGHDAAFTKDPLTLAPLIRPPFYAVKNGVALTNTHGGTKINERMEVLNKEDDPIPGLYAAGVETGAHDWDSYNMWLSGHSFGFTINSGRIAGEEAVKYGEKK
jgi:fumarate reductase flavoprotein subunit